MSLSYSGSDRFSNVSRSRLRAPDRPKTTSKITTFIGAAIFATSALTVVPTASADYLDRISCWHCLGCRRRSART